MMISRTLRDNKMVDEAFNGDYIIKENDSFKDESSWLFHSLNKFKIPSFKKVDIDTELFKVYRKNVRHYQTDKIQLSFLLPSNIKAKTNPSSEIVLEQTSTKHDFIKKVLSFKTLVNNWDGYGAIPLELESATNAITIISLADDLIISKINDLYPNPNGTVSILWKNLNDTISLEIGNDSMSYYVKRLEKNIEFFDNIKIDPLTVEKLSSFIGLL